MKRQGGDMRLIVAVLLMTLTAPAWAEWVKYGETDWVVVYYDPTTIGRNGELRQVWTILDLKKRRRRGGLSRRYLSSYDCQQNRKRILSRITYSDHMAGGKVVRKRETPGEWFNIRPHTFSATMHQIVCQ